MLCYFQWELLPSCVRVSWTERPGLFSHTHKHNDDQQQRRQQIPRHSDGCCWSIKMEEQITLVHYNKHTHVYSEGMSAGLASFTKGKHKKSLFLWRGSSNRASKNETLLLKHIRRYHLLPPKRTWFVCLKSGNRVWYKEAQQIDRSSQKLDRSD